MKINRHALILDIISEKDIETQEQLAEELRRRGIEVTQATVSRDIKELRLVKVLSPSGIYKYAPIDREENGVSDRLIRVFSESVVSMESANNLIVIKTISGSAMAAAGAIDALNWKEIIGCIAGDDTILVVVKKDELVNDVMKKFSKLMKA
ncbi:MAG TPA: arginine repressor [Clostridiales bacterium]|nr:arginine repressor [Clostridiales bacterium]